MKENKNVLIIDFNMIRLIVDGEVIQLSFVEAKLLSFLVKNAGIVQSKRDIIKAVWDYDTNNYSSLLTTIKTLRKKMGRYRDRIMTIHKVGYVFFDE